MCFNDNDQKLWEEDSHEYVRKGYDECYCSKCLDNFIGADFDVLSLTCFSADIIEDLYSPRTASMDFVSELVRKRGKENLQKFILYIVEVFKKYDEAPVEYKPYRQKDGALLAIGALCDKLKLTEPYKSKLEHMLVQHVFPEFRSLAGHLRGKIIAFTSKRREFLLSESHCQAFFVDSAFVTCYDMILHGQEYGNRYSSGCGFGVEGLGEGEGKLGLDAELHLDAQSTGLLTTAEHVFASFCLSRSGKQLLISSTKMSDLVEGTHSFASPLKKL
ncbi:hypothetical protein IFM89_010351 [Coptis chinensis]|uniref:Uncharacterized protein n=1 Tax=Coptis chinensis TaxID=261450 RepID=A0A835LRH6_9MAGN|nr:hypothetical protein IFM89_010351 [Coptis chinensis]